MSEAKKETGFKNWIKKHPIWTTVIGLFIFFVILVTLSEPTAPQVKNSPIQDSSTTSTEEQQLVVDDIEIVNVETKVTESNSTWSKYSWLLTLKNNTSKDKSINVELRWLDADGFVLETTDAYGLVVKANSEEKFSDYNLINASLVQDIESIEAVVK